jgi:hypothetical protein
MGNLMNFAAGQFRAIRFLSSEVNSEVYMFFEDKCKVSSRRTTDPIIRASPRQLLKVNHSYNYVHLFNSIFSSYKRLL